jgi:hypothetical protein
MDFKRLGTFLIIGGVVVIVAAFAWWMSFYSSILRELARAPGAPTVNNGVFDLFSCFYSSRDVCGFIAGFARLVGRTPYEPMALWVGLAGLIAGLAIRFAAKPAGSVGA